MNFVDIVNKFSHVASPVAKGAKKSAHLNHLQPLASEIIRADAEPAISVRAAQGVWTISISCQHSEAGIDVGIAVVNDGNAIPTGE
jgi:hypothetical protein